MGFDYPSENDIVDPRPGLPPATVELLNPCFEEGQWLLREWRDNPVRGEQGAIEILCGIAVGVLDCLAQEALREHADSFEAFRSAIGPDGGAAELGMKYAHFIYRDVDRGRMPGRWHAHIRSQFFDGISAAEKKWWQMRRAKSAAEEPATRGATRDTAGTAARRRAVVEPALDTKGWSILRWAHEAEVDYNTASDFLNGLTAPHRRTRVRLAKALGIPVVELPK